MQIDRNAGGTFSSFSVAIGATRRAATHARARQRRKMKKNVFFCAEICFIPRSDRFACLVKGKCITSAWKILHAGRKRVIYAARWKATFFPVSSLSSRVFFPLPRCLRSQARFSNADLGYRACRNDEQRLHFARNSIFGGGNNRRLIGSLRWLARAFPSTVA